MTAQPTPFAPAGSASSAAGRLAWTALAVIVHVVLVSAAIETFRSQAPARWWILSSVGAYLTTLAACWRLVPGVRARLAPAVLATTGSGVFLVLLAVTAWLPGGSVAGLRLFGLPTSTLLAGVSAVAVGLAGVSLVRLRLLPPWARYALGALAAYGVLSFALGIANATPYASLFHGGSFWTRVPRWLQGAFVGALGLLPLAILTQIVRVIDHLRRKEPVRSPIHQTTAFVMALVMATSGLVPPGGGATATRSSSPVEPDPIVSIGQWRTDAFGGKDPLALWDQYSRAAQEELRKPGADPSDVKTKADALGHDAQRIFEFMRDEITLEPYTGVLRGARGTLAAGAGNALDRALLAQALLNAEGIESRLVAGKLSSAQAEALLTRYLATGPVPAPLARLIAQPEESTLKAAARDLSTRVDLSENRVSDLLHHARVMERAFWLRADAQRATQFDFLTDQLRRGGVKTAIDGAALLATLRQRLQEHYWLQVRESDGTWSDFDPTLSDARRAVAYGAEPISLGKVPGDRYHRFEFSLVYHTVSQGAAKQEVLTTGSFASADALFAPLEFRLQPATMAADANAVSDMDARHRIEMLRKTKRFRGFLRAGSETTGGRQFDLEGNTYGDSAAPAKGPAGALLGDFFGGGGAVAKVQFVELQAVLRLTGPGREPMTQTRTLVQAADLTSPTFAPPLVEWQILVQPQWISDQLAGFQMLSLVTALGKAAKDASSAGYAGPSVEPLPPVPLQLLQLALLRQRATAGILATHDGVRALVDQPMLTISGHRLTALDDQGGRIIAERSIDIVENAVRYVARDETSKVAAFDAGLRQGVADCALEDRFLQDSYPGTIALSGSTIIQRAQRERRPVSVASAQEVDKLRQSGMTSGDVEWIRANESPTARLVIATTPNGPNAWWSVRPDGNAVLRASGGRGQATVEHVVILASKLFWGAVCIYEMKEVIGGRIRGLASLEKMLFCMCALTGAGTFLILKAHTASVLLIFAEFLEFEVTRHMGGHE